MTGITGRTVARLSVACTLVSCAVGLAACKQVELASSWTAEGVEVDGVNDEWIGAITYLEKQDVTVGLLNDEEFLYVSLVTSGPAGRQAMATGLTVWFDPDGGTDEWYGIRFPVPPEPSQRSRGGRGGRGGDGRAGGRGGGRPGGGGGASPLERLREVELVGPGELIRRRLPLPVGGGLEVAIRNNGPTFVYELKVALARNDDYRMGLGVEPGSEIGVGFVTGNIGRQGRGGRGGFGGGRGGDGGRGGGRGGPGGGDRPDRPDPLKLWAKVQLSAEPTNPKLQRPKQGNPLSVSMITGFNL